MKLPTVKCPTCKTEWIPRVPEPKKCISCGRPLAARRQQKEPGR